MQYMDLPRWFNVVAVAGVPPPLPACGFGWFTSGHPWPDFSKAIQSSGFLHRAQQRVLVAARELVDLGDLGFGDLAREDTTNTLATGMNVQHHLGRAFAVHAEEGFQHDDH